MKRSAYGRGLAWAAALGLLLAGCGTLPPLGAPGPGQPVVTRPIRDVAGLLEYNAYLRKLTSAELAREYERASSAFVRDRSGVNRLKLALLLSLPNASFSDESRALEVLEPLLKDDAPQDQALKNFAYLLHSWIAQAKRLDNSLQSTSQKLKEEQKRANDLQHKLDELKSIEQSLIDRERGKTRRK